MSKEVWTRIETWLKSHAPEILGELGGPASAADFETLEAVIGRPLPDDFKQAYAIHDGQADENHGLVEAGTLLSLAGIARQYSIWKELLDEGTFVDAQSSSPTGVRTDWWSPGWIPITHDGGGNHTCIDLDPAPGGTRGQVISFWHDDPERTILAPSFAKWLADYADRLESGRMVYSDDYGGIVDKDDA